MCISSYILILSLSLFSQGFLLSVSKSLQEVEDEDMLLTTLNLGKTLQNGDKALNRGAIPLLKHYKTEDSVIFNEKNDGNMKFLDTGSRRDFLNHVRPINFGRKQLLKGAMVFPVDTEIPNIESIQERETTDEENSPKFPIGRRDFDILRCMLGRVYRPCWQA
ncbi:pro-MCH [Chiroxiphia lanceolata]|uniref:pro-MCH n=1 Tax=Chiroxiphia lanceolata TaxID=296741 RepID=UPI0013CEA47F|nr:pro-MCH [Chiroxiphia lanceolata]